MGNGSSATPNKIKLTYFDVRLRGEAIRLSLAYAALPYSDVRIKPPFDPDTTWPDIKPNTPWSQLPILEVDGKVIGQSFTIARYLAKITSIYGKCPLEQAKYDAITDACSDVLDLWLPWKLEKEETVKEDKAKNIREKLKVLVKQLEKFLGKDNFYGGNKLSYADLQFYNLWEVYKFSGFEDCFQSSTPLLGLVNRIQNIPRIKQYLENRKFTEF